MIILAIARVVSYTLYRKEWNRIIEFRKNSKIFSVHFFILARSCAVSCPTMFEDGGQYLCEIPYVAAPHEYSLEGETCFNCFTVENVQFR